MSTNKSEIEQMKRFEFGKNWSQFLHTLNEERISQASKSLREFLEIEDLSGLRFLDIGCGSGLFSLVARMLGASVYSFDYDSQSVECARALYDRFFPEDANWTIEEGSVLDEGYVRSLGDFDIVYSWGVLHHTGDMKKALANAGMPVRAGGLLFIAIYNDQGRISRRWERIKKFYCALPRSLKSPFAIAMMLPRETKLLLKYGLTLRPHRYVQKWTKYSSNRGMSRWYDHVDWLGGYPFEVAKPEEILHFYRERGLSLERMQTVGGGAGNNEFLFRNSTV